jgi:hypothetical protein
MPAAEVNEPLDFLMQERPRAFLLQGRAFHFEARNGKIAVLAAVGDDPRRVVVEYNHWHRAKLVQRVKTRP